MSRTMLILVMVACLLVGTTSQSSSLCLSCASYFGTFCISCNNGGCAAYSTKAASGIMYLNNRTVRVQSNVLSCADCHWISLLRSLLRRLPHLRGAPCDQLPLLREQLHLQQ